MLCSAPIDARSSESVTFVKLNSPVAENLTNSSLFAKLMVGALNDGAAELKALVSKR